VKKTTLQNNWDNPEGGLDGLMQVSAAKRPKRRPFISKADLNPSGRPNLRPPNGGDKARNGGDGIKFYFLRNAGISPFNITATERLFFFGHMTESVCDYKKFFPELAGNFR
jgi:hypothetical protein